MVSYFLKSKIHRATVTDADLNYEGSISIDPVLCEGAHLLPYERVDVYNVDNGQRFTTYVIYGKTGEICVNGAAARMVHKGDRVIIVSYVGLNTSEISDHKPQVVFVNANNSIKSIEQSAVSGAK